MTSTTLRQRRSIRLPDYDYSQPGAYFVTICTFRRALLFEEFPQYGELVLETWQDLPNHYPCVALDAFVVMPNHVHGIIFLEGDGPVGAGFDPVVDVGAGFKPAPTKGTKRHGLPEIVRAFKTFSARRINALKGTPGVPVWQRSYYEHVVRTDEELDRIREYIVNNPLRWEYDRENPEWAGVETAEKEIWEFLKGRVLPDVAALRDKWRQRNSSIEV